MPVAGSADGPAAALVVGVVGVPSDHTMEARRGFSKDVACADQSINAAAAAAAVGSCGVDAEGEMMLSDGGRAGRDLEATRAERGCVADSGELARVFWSVKFGPGGDKEPGLNCSRTHTQRQQARTGQAPPLQARAGPLQYSQTAARLLQDGTGRGKEQLVGVCLRQRWLRAALHAAACTVTGRQRGLLLLAVPVDCAPAETVLTIGMQTATSTHGMHGRLG
jgi:hypothetical protein